MSPPVAKESNIPLYGVKSTMAINKRFKDRDLLIEGTAAANDDPDKNAVALKFLTFLQSRLLSFDKRLEDIRKHRLLTRQDAHRHRHPRN